MAEGLTEDLSEQDLESVDVVVFEFSALAENEIFVNRRQHRFDDGRLHQARVLPLGDDGRARRKTETVSTER